MEEIIKNIAKLDTLMIPIVYDGLPFVRLDQIEELFWNAGADASPITDRIHNLMAKFGNGQDCIH